jgi:ATP-dependent protease HslVU (ClpYQ) peptidase subunit
MTVIAFDHKTKTLAVDSQFTSGGDRISYGRKFRHIRDGVAVFAGCAVSGMKALDLLEAGEPLTHGLIEKVTVVVMMLHGKKKGHVYSYNDSVHPERVKRIYAWGSGGDYALGALSAGANAHDAVQIACHYSASCGGTIHVFSPER